MGLAVTRTDLGDIVVLRLTGAAAGQVPRLRRALETGLGSRPQAMIVDLKDVRLGGTAAALALVEIAEQARRQGCRVVACRASAEDARWLARLPIGTRLRVYPSFEAATEGLLLLDDRVR